ncbi:hypothetical protein JD844_000962 [Phrynosoma platyrhinos]|uniref:CARMIL C-terminal domain-containing protein n=1 Tax=Phrynosoma platyrhinos TaxID=52577 RepID=A0ABQ7T8X3_PHRPL|nr:hypothetical protein JD844_000962 [Phrynosoma platyrhinos]
MLSVKKGYKVLTTWRIYLFALKVPAKILVETEKANYSFKFPNPESADQVTRHVNTALAKIFPSPASVCLIRHGNVETPETPRDMSPNSESSNSTTHSICGGFSETYAALCDYNGHSCREEVQWDVDTIYHSEDNREFNLLDFCHLESRDLALIVAALAYNQWFTKLYCKDLRLGSEVAEQVLHTVSKSHHLEELVLDNAGLKTEFALKLACVLSENLNTALHALTLSHNPLEDKGLAVLCQTFGANPAFTSSLRHLDLSKNPGLLGTDEANGFYSFLAQPNALVHLDLSSTDCAVDALFGALLHGCCPRLSYLNLARNTFSHRSLFQGLSANTHLSELHLDLSGCESLQTFSVADSRLKTRTSILINALGSNTCLTKVDLSGNCMEDIGAKMLSKALQINSTLRSITWDRNNTTAQGFQDIARALENNYTLKFMSFPMSDITTAYRSAPERTDEVWQKIQWCLLRNNHSQKFPQDQAFRLHQGIVTNSAEQMMSRLCVRVQEEVRVLRTCSADTVQEEVLYARELMKEAKNSRALFPSLYELGHILASDGPVRHKLESVANEVSKAVDKELQMILESMVTLTQELCPHAVQAAEEHNKMLATVSERVTVPRNFIRGALLEQAGQDIQNKLNEVKLSVVTYLTNTIVEELLQELYHAHKNLAQHIIHLRRLSGGQDSAAFPEQLGKPRLHDREETTDDELCSNIDTMAIKRQKNCRRIRPASAFISGSEQEGDLIVPRMGSPLGWISLASSSQYSHSRSTSFEGLSDLPTEGVRLEHRTRGRPRPPRTAPHGGFRSHNRILGSIESREQENGSVPRIDEGLDEFFNKKVLADNTSYPRTPKGCGVRPGPSDSLPPLQKKRRRGLFHFRKYRSIKGERDPEDLPPSPPPPPMSGEEQKPPLRPSASQEEERKLGQDMTGLGILLPGMGAIPVGRQGGRKPHPPLQSTKPSFATIRRAEASWDIAEESSPRENSDKEPTQDNHPEGNAGGTDQKGVIVSTPNSEDQPKVPAKQFREPPSIPRPPKPVALPRGRKPPSQPERSRSNEEPGVAGGSILEDTRDPEVGRKAAPLKPKRTRRAQSCDKLDSDRCRNLGSGGANDTSLPDPPPPPPEYNPPTWKSRPAISQPLLPADWTVGRNSRIWDRMMDRRSLEVVAATGSCEAFSSPGRKSEGT